MATVGYIRLWCDFLYYDKLSNVSDEHTASIFSSSRISANFYEIIRRHVPKNFFQLWSRVSTPAEGTSLSIIHLFLEGWCPSYSLPLLFKFSFPSLFHRPVNCYFNSLLLLLPSCIPSAFLSVSELTKMLRHKYSFITISSFTQQLDFLSSPETCLSEICSFVYLINV
jgi:hypothetical protein